MKADLINLRFSLQANEQYIQTLKDHFEASKIYQNAALLYSISEKIKDAERDSENLRKLIQENTPRE
jgi:hypothetical protein